MRTVALIAICALALPAASAASDATVRQTLRSGISAVDTTPDATRLAHRLVIVLASLRCDHGSTPAGRRGRALAIRGFRSTLRGVNTQLSMRVHDSGRLEAAVRDARRADRYLNRGARLLRAAGRELGVRIGRVNGR
jgi:hypothetical protein